MSVLSWTDIFPDHLATDKIVDQRQSLKPGAPKELGIGVRLLNLPIKWRQKGSPSAESGVTVGLKQVQSPSFPAAYALPPSSVSAATQKPKCSTHSSKTVTPKSITQWDSKESHEPVEWLS